MKFNNLFLPRKRCDAIRLRDSRREAAALMMSAQPREIACALVADSVCVIPRPISFVRPHTPKVLDAPTKNQLHSAQRSLT